MIQINNIVIHCSATREDQDYTFAQLDADHRKRGFKQGCGYNLYIRRDGTVHMGRPFGATLAHATGYNNDSFAICYEGGLDTKGKPKDTRTPQQRQVLMTAVLFCKLLAPKARVLGHRDLSPDRNGDGKITKDEWLKDCPCFEVGFEYGDYTPK
jgi:N-acetylmuramoyl-L-alanine amidase